MKLKKSIGILLSLLVIIGLFAGCTSNNTESGNDKTVTLGLVEWADAIAITNLGAVVLEDYMDYKVEMTVADIGPIYTSVANGSTDAYLQLYELN